MLTNADGTVAFDGLWVRNWPEGQEPPEQEEDFEAAA